MGSGKTTYMMKDINDANLRYLGNSFDDEALERPKFIYVAPLLDEVDRIREACPDIDFRDPVPVEGRKLYHLESLVDQGHNICTTHSLFKLITTEICDKIKAQGYTLVIDETLECVAIYDDITKADRDILFKNKIVYLEEGTNRVVWNHKDRKDYKGKFDNVKRLCDNGNLVMCKQDIMVWTFPTDFLRAFDDVYVLTYLFSGSIMSSYLKAEGLDYEVRTLNTNKELVPLMDNGVALAIKRGLRDLVTVYEGPLNSHGRKSGKTNPFSVGWLIKQNGKALQAIKGSTEHFFKSVANTPAYKNAWTTFGRARRSLKGERYSKGFIPCNAKATNQHKHKASLAYLCNIFYQPPIMSYFQERGIEVDQEAFALSEMVQWIWRSQIREGKPITVFIPSERMRTLFLAWLNEEDALAIAA